MRYFCILEKWSIPGIQCGIRIIEISRFLKKKAENAFRTLAPAYEKDLGAHVVIQR